MKTKKLLALLLATVMLLGLLPATALPAGATDTNYKFKVTSNIAFATEQDGVNCTRTPWRGCTRGC